MYQDKSTTLTPKVGANKNISKINYISYFIVVSLLFLTTGCASITGSKNQPITITAVCESAMVQGASCTITNDKGVSYASTPGTVMVNKSTSDMTISCTKNKLHANPIVVQSSSNASIWGNVLLGGPIGAAVDAGTGAGFNYPPSVNVIFNPPCAEMIVSPIVVPAIQPQRNSVASSVSGDRIRELNKLFESGDISKNEYDAKKKILIDGL
tara:strand:+ start:48 stop:680 length:633 start_codon:yes stop_codon:yes gene_type:complete